MQELRLEYVPLDELLEKRWAENPKSHHLGLLHTSISRFGFASAIIVNEETGLIVAGHGRLKALEQMRASGEPPPKYVRVVEATEEEAEDVWEAPALRGLRLSELEGKAFAIAANQSVVGSAFVLAEMWDEVGLTAVLQELSDIGLDGTGFDLGDVQAQLDRQAYLATVDLEALMGPAVTAEKKSFAPASVGGEGEGLGKPKQQEEGVEGWLVTCPHCSCQFRVEVGQ